MQNIFWSGGYRRALLFLISLAAAMTVTCSTLKVYRISKLSFPNKSGVLANGLRVVIQPDPNLPYVTVLMRYDVGAAHDPEGKRGLAHLVEHLAFRLGDELVETFRRTPVTKDQVEFTKRDLINDFTGSGHTTESAVKDHVSMMSRDRPRGFKTESIQWIAGLTREDVQQVIDDILGHPPILVIAGPSPTIPNGRSGPYPILAGEVTAYTAAELLR